jgi:hypothetical protein
VGSSVGRRARSRRGVHDSRSDRSDCAQPWMVVTPFTLFC